jgi:ribonuclease-3
MLGLGHLFRRRNTGEKDLVRFIRNITGYAPRELAIYKLAFQHISTVRNGQDTTLHSNERLEFLGDAILGGVIAEYLFKRFPTKDEGYLTELRSRIVSRTNLNDVCLKLGLERMLKYDRNGNAMNRSIFGNTLEAFLGAMYLDQGYHRTHRFIVRRVLTLCVDLDKLVNLDLNYKSRLLNYAQKNKLDTIRFVVVAESTEGRMRQFTVAAQSGDIVLGTGTDIKKKVAEQKASAMALEKLQSAATLPVQHTA